MRTIAAAENGGVILETPAEEPFAPCRYIASGPALKIRRILVPVDFSACSKKALLYAVAFAKQFDAEVVLLHVIEASPIVPEVRFIEEREMPNRRRELLTLQQSIAADVRSTTAMRSGLTHLKIAEMADECGADLIIIATHGRTGLARVVLGSTTESVVRYAPCPVLVVREREREFTDDSVDSTSQAPGER